MKWWCVFGEVEVIERVWRGAGVSYERPFTQVAGVRCRGKSLRLEQAMCDFGAEESFARASERLKIHYGFDLGANAMREATLHHARRASELLEESYKQPYRVLPQQGEAWVVAELDGSMVCTVEPKRRRKAKRPRAWKEIRVAVARGQTSAQSHYAASFGEVDLIGRRWAHCTRAAGWSLQGQVHVVADGAEWIRRQSREIFGDQENFLVDFYHLSEYLAEAGTTCRPANSRQWLRTQQKRLKVGAQEKVFGELRKNLEHQDVPEQDAPVRAALRYMENRADSLDYPAAIAKELPIGSGMVESAHRHLIQARLKAPGAAWLPENAEAMAQLRVTKANHLWQTLWN